ncbi:MAG: hypothetical protein ICV66_02830 [Chitinophagaceae bacterium]|nr:hypothetical protein [Chitinophagaceae bacterium]
MDKTIKTYDDLLAEEQRLTALLNVQKELIAEDIAGVKEGLKPVKKVYEFMQKMATRDNASPLMNFGMEMGIDLFIRRLLLARAGWLTKIVVPFFVKNYSSHLIGEEKREAWFKKVRNLLKKITPKAQPQTSETTLYTDY